jgi:hypothetical protein
MECAVEFVVGGVLALVLGAWMVLRREAMNESTHAWQKKVNKDDPTPPPDYRTGVLVGGSLMMAGGVIMIIVGIAI